MTSDSIKKSFQATGVWPMDAEVILKRFNNNTTQHSGTSEIGEHGDGDSWHELRKIFDAAVADKAKVEAKQLSASLHSLQTQNELLYHENDNLRAALSTKKKQQEPGYKLDLQQRKEYHGGAVFWSPRKLREARTRETVKQREAEELQLQKKQGKGAEGGINIIQKNDGGGGKVGAAAQKRAGSEG